MHRTPLFCLFLFLCLHASAELSVSDSFSSAASVHGYVLDQDNNPVVGAVMSDGFEVVKTDQTGYYEILLNELSEFVFVSVPCGFDIPLEEGAPKMYAAVNLQTTQTCNFTLQRQADGGKADMNHVMLAISDPQVLNDYDLWRYENETLEDIKSLIASYPAGTKIYASIVGDIVWDLYGAFPKQKENMASLGIPCFMTIGNHDHNTNHACEENTVLQDRVADDLFTDAFGPHYYSWNIGSIHYISLDNVFYTGCKGQKNYDNAVSTEQLDWILKDLDMLPEGTPVVIFCHVPMYNETNSLNIFKDELNKGNVTQYIISGHTHHPRIYKHADWLWEHNLGAAEGAFWSSNWCADGAPNGYEVLQASANGYTDFYYKATGYDRDYQFRAYSTTCIPAGNGKNSSILANVWFWDEGWTVNIYENGVKHKMDKFTGTDPVAYDVLLADGDNRPNYPGTEGGTIASKNPGSCTTRQMFYYWTAKPDADFEVEVIDRFDNVYRQPVMRNMMAAYFTEKDNQWTYEQDFNSLFSYPNHFSASLAKGTFVQGHYPLGWYVSTNGSGSKDGTFNYYCISNGSHSYGALYNYGAGDPSKATANSTERSLGLLPAVNHRSLAAGVLLENNTKQDITSLDIQYTGEIWRVGSELQAQTMKFAYLVNPDAKALRERSLWIGNLDMQAFSDLDFTTPATLTAMEPKTAVDGDNPLNQKVVRATLNVTLHPGETILLRWNNDYNSGKEQGMAIDDIIIRASSELTGVVEVGTDATVAVRKAVINGQLIITRGNHNYNALGMEL